MGYKIIFSDLDDTVIKRFGNAFTKEMYETIQKIMERDILFVPCTGRAYSNFPINFPYPLKYAIHCNGALIKDCENNVNIYDQSLPYNNVKEMLEYLKTFDGFVYVFANEKMYTDNYYLEKCKSSDRYAYYLEANIFKENLADYFFNNNVSVQKVSFISTNRDYVVGCLKKKFPQFLYTPFSNDTIEITTLKANKGDAAKFLCEYLNIDLKDAVALGDSDNDLQVLNVAGYVIVPSNANDNTKKIANVIGGSTFDNTFYLTLIEEIINK